MPRTALISGMNADEKWRRILDYYSKAAGEKLKLIDEVYRSEAATNQGNKALAALWLSMTVFIPIRQKQLYLYQAVFGRLEREATRPDGSDPREQRHQPCDT